MAYDTEVTRPSSLTLLDPRMVSGLTWHHIEDQPLGIGSRSSEDEASVITAGRANWNRMVVRDRRTLQGTENC